MFQCNRLEKMALKELNNEAVSPINSIVIIHPNLKQKLLKKVQPTTEKENSYRICVDSSLSNTVSIQSQTKKVLYSYTISKSIFDPETASFYWHNVRPFVESTLIGYHGMIIFLQSSHVQLQKVTPFDLLFKSIDQILKCIYRSKYKHTQYFQVLFSHYALSIEGGHLVDLCSGLDPASYLYRENNGKQQRLVKTRLIDLEHLKNLIDKNHAQFVTDLSQTSAASVNLSNLGYHEFICVNVGFLGFSASFAPIGGELTFVILSTDYLKDSQVHTANTLDVITTTKGTTKTFKPLLAFLDKVTSLTIDIDSDDEDPLCELLRDGIGGACKTCFISSLPDRYELAEFENEKYNENHQILQIAYQSSLVFNYPNRKVFAEKALMNIYLHEIDSSAQVDTLNVSEATTINERSTNDEVGEDSIKQAAVALEQAVREYTDGLESEGFDCEMDVSDDNTHEISHNRNEIVETGSDSQKLALNFEMDNSINVNFENTVTNEPIESTSQTPLEKRTVILGEKPDEVIKTNFNPDCGDKTGITSKMASKSDKSSSEIVATQCSSERTIQKSDYKVSNKQENSDDIITKFQQQISGEEPLVRSPDNQVSRNLRNNPGIEEEFLSEEKLTLEESKNRSEQPPTHDTNISTQTNAYESKISNESADISPLDNSTIQIEARSSRAQQNVLPVRVIIEIAPPSNVSNAFQYDSDRSVRCREQSGDRDLRIVSPALDIPIGIASDGGNGVKIEFEQKNVTDSEFKQHGFLIDDSDSKGIKPNGYPIERPHSHIIADAQASKATSNVSINNKPEINYSRTNNSLSNTDMTPGISQLDKTNTKGYPMPLTDSPDDIESPGLLKVDLKDDVNVTAPLSLHFPKSDLRHANTEQVDIICKEEEGISKPMRNTMQLPFLSNDKGGIEKRLEVTSPLLGQIDGNQGDGQIAEIVTFMLQDPVRGAPRSHQARGSKEVLQRRDLGGVFTGHAITSWLLNNVHGIQNWSEAEVFGQWLLDQDALIHSEGSLVFAGAESLFYYARRSQPCTGLLGSDEIKRRMSEAKKVLQIANTEFFDANASSNVDKNETFSALGSEAGLANDDMIYHQLIAEQSVVLNEASDNENSLSAHFANEKLNQSRGSSVVSCKQGNESLSNSVSSGGKGNTKKFLWNSEVKNNQVNSLNASQGPALSEMFQTRDIEVRKSATEPGITEQVEENNEVSNIIQRQNTVLVGNLTQKYVEINTNKFELHPLFENCRDGCRTGVLRNLVMSFGVNFEDERKRTGLFYAAASDQGRVGHELINSHATVNHIDSSHTSPLLVAVEHGHISFMSMLLSNNADVTHFDKTGTNAYHLACKLEATVCIQKLLRKIKPGVLDRIDRRGFTPLHYAIRNQFSGHVEMLLRHSPTLSVLDSNGLGYLSFAIHSHSFNCIAPLIKAFPQLAGQTNADFSTPLHVAAIQSAPEYLALLLNTKSCRRHYNIQDGDNQGRSPLHAACKKGVDETVIMLVRHNAPAISLDNNGLSSLQYAKANGRLSQEVIELLEVTEVDEVKGVMKLQDNSSKTCQIQ